MNLIDQISFHKEKLAHGQIMNLLDAMSSFRCGKCGLEQKEICKESGDCLLISWLDKQINIARR